jgi:hypothetical protein
VAQGVIERRGPPQPNLVMGGRTAAALVRQVDAWHRQLARMDQPVAEWRPCGLPGFEFVEGSERGANLKIWTISELLSAKALTAEGRAMKHCVATYARSCARGHSSIWSMRVETYEGRRQQLTIEVRNAARLICQARGRCNAPANEKERSLLRRWAIVAGLSVANYV